MSVTFALEGLDELKAEMRQLKHNVAVRVPRIVEDACVEGAKEARSTHRYQDRTGTLTDKTTGRLVSTSEGAAEGEIVADTPYAAYVSDGTRPHDIEPRRATSLRWEDAQGAHFAKKVHHPGTQADPFMGNAYLKAERVLEREAEVVLEKAAEKFGR